MLIYKGNLSTGDDQKLAIKNSKLPKNSDGLNKRQRPFQKVQFSLSK